MKSGSLTLPLGSIQSRNDGLLKGFPDFIAIKPLGNKTFDIIGVEVKVNGLLDKTEKEKCKAFLEKGVFSEIWIASKEKEGRNITIKYQDVKERFGRFFNS